MNKSCLKRRSLSILLAFVMAFTLLLTAMPSNLRSVFAASNYLETTEGSANYALFNSGRTGGASRYGSSRNYDEDSLTNGGYDLYASYSSLSRIRLGLGFKVNYEITEKAQLTIYAYDVDEEDGERDVIYLVDETTGVKTRIEGYLHGCGSQWNTTTMEIDPSYFAVGHTYHFELREEVYGWVVYVRSVSLQLNGAGGQIDVNGELNASISSSGLISTVLTISSTNAYTYNLEYSAKNGYNQYASATSSVYSTPEGATVSKTFQLGSGAPKGTYTITVLVKNASGNVVLSKSVQAGYAYYSVSYHSNGGSNNLPKDGNAYTTGSSTTVKYDYLPSREGYDFIGWSTNPSATTPEFTKNGNNTLTIGSSDVHLYAVWKEEVICAHSNVKWVIDEEATCVKEGVRHSECLDCGEIVKTENYSSDNHAYEVTSMQEATCTEDGYMILTCQNGCGATKQQIVLASGHEFGKDNVCDKCGFTYEVHEHSFTESVVEPECTKVGYTVYTCECGYSYRDNYVDQKGHSWDEGEITLEATCTTNGVFTHHCTEPDCTAVLELPIEAGHVWEESVVTPATCTTDGEMVRTCSSCGTTENVILPAGHTWDEGTVITPESCTEDGLKHCTCEVCGEEGDLPIEHTGHEFYNGVCTRCGATIPDVVTPDGDHPEYGMYFEIEDIISDYGPDLINEYGVLLDYNKDANIKKVAVFLTQDGTMWRRCIACVGENISYATYVPYLSYDEKIKYTGLNHDWINIFPLSKNSDGIWCYSDYATIGVNLQDYMGRLLLSLYDIGQAGAKTRVFDDLNEMVDWLKEGSDCINHEEGEWIVDKDATAQLPGSMHTECTCCGQVIQTKEIPLVPQVIVSSATINAGAMVEISIDIKNNPGILGAALTLSFDVNLILVEVRVGKAWSMLDFTKPGEYSSPCNFIWDGVSEEDASSGSLIILVFKVAEGTAVGSELGIDISFGSKDIVNGTYEAVEVEVVNGTITVDSLIGDVNSDGLVDVADVVALRRYLAGGYDIVIDDLVADVNNDGEITIADVIELRRYIAGGYGVEL